MNLSTGNEYFKWQEKYNFWQNFMQMFDMLYNAFEIEVTSS